MGVVQAQSTRSAGVVIWYVRGAKHDRCVLESGVGGIIPGYAEQQFRRTREAWGKDQYVPQFRRENGELVPRLDKNGEQIYGSKFVQAYPLVMSFGRDELDPDDPESWACAEALARGLVEDYFPVGTEAYLGVQTNGTKSGCVHVHVVVNAVNPITGRSLDSSLVRHQDLAAAFEKVMANQGFVQRADLARIAAEAEGRGGRFRSVAATETARERQRLVHVQWGAERAAAQAAGEEIPVEPFSVMMLEERAADALADPRSSDWGELVKVGREHGVVIGKRGKDVTYGMLRLQPDGTLAEPATSDRRRGSSLGEGFRVEDVEAAIERNADLAQQAESEDDPLAGLKARWQAWIDADCEGDWIGDDELIALARHAGLRDLSASEELLVALGMSAVMAEDFVEEILNRGLHAQATHTAEEYAEIVNAVHAEALIENEIRDCWNEAHAENQRHDAEAAPVPTRAVEAIAQLLVRAANYVDDQSLYGRFSSPLDQVDIDAVRVVPKTGTPPDKRTLDEWVSASSWSMQEVNAKFHASDFQDVIDRLNRVDAWLVTAAEVFADKERQHDERGHVYDRELVHDYVRAVRECRTSLRALRESDGVVRVEILEQAARTIDTDTQRGKGKFGRKPKRPALVKEQARLDSSEERLDLELVVRVRMREGGGCYVEERLRDGAYLLARDTGRGPGREQISRQLNASNAETYLSRLKAAAQGNWTPDGEWTKYAVRGDVVEQDDGSYRINTSTLATSRREPLGHDAPASSSMSGAVRSVLDATPDVSQPSGNDEPQAGV